MEATPVQVTSGVTTAFIRICLRPRLISTKSGQFSCVSVSSAVQLSESFTHPGKLFRYSLVLGFVIKFREVRLGRSAMVLPFIRPGCSHYALLRSRRRDRICPPLFSAPASVQVGTLDCVCLYVSPIHGWHDSHDLRCLPPSRCSPQRPLAGRGGGHMASTDQRTLVEGPGGRDVGISVAWGSLRVPPQWLSEQPFPLILAVFHRCPNAVASQRSVP